MNKNNEAIKTGLNYALGALFALDDQGICVLDADVDSARPSLIVDREPAGVSNKRRFSSHVGNKLHVLNAGELLGCKVHWKERGEPTPNSAAA